MGYKINIDPENIFFTDESIFPLYTYMNKGTKKIRLSNKENCESDFKNKNPLDMLIILFIL